jgi:cytidylate kinase
MSNRVITISREFGSGGRTIGKLVADKLGIPCYDAELIEKIAEQSGYSAEYIKQEVEYGSGGWFSAMFADRSAGLTNQDKMFSIQSRIIEELAEEGPCVIVGRCADFVLRDKADCLNVFIHASMEKRAERIVKEYGERTESPEKRLKEKDKRRAAYHRFYTDMKWGHAQNYHVCLDSGEFGIEKCAEIIAQLY